ncbi:hypothetical protein FXO38_16455, partial [Capsicum annuum]
MLIDLGVLDDSLVLSKGANCMKITYKEVQGTLKRPMIGKTGLESPRKRTCTPSPSALEMRPSCFRYARAGQNNPSCSRNVPHKTQQELDESVQELAARAADLAKTEAAKNIAAPNSAYQFEVSWRGLSGDRNLQTHLLKITSPAMLPRIFKNALSASMLMDILRCVATFFIEDMNLAIRYLEDLTKVPRFDMIIMCLSSTDKSVISNVGGDSCDGWYCSDCYEGGGCDVMLFDVSS